MGSLFKRRENTVQPTYQNVESGGIPGAKEGATGLLSQLQAWLANPSLIPGYGEAQKYLGTLPTGQATDILTQRTAPDYLTKESPYLSSVFSGWGAQSAKDKALAQRSAIMDFGSAGHTFSSPLVAKLGQTASGYDQALADRVAATQYADYGNRENLQTQALETTLQQRLATLLQQPNAMSILGPYIQMLLGGQPQSQWLNTTPQVSYQPSFFEQLLGAAGSYYGAKAKG